jgi:hypothetical protein
MDAPKYTSYYYRSHVSSHATLGALIPYGNVYEKEQRTLSLILRALFV